ncbi:MAG: MBL fold metallo-hydrolase [Porphyromonadaceae bacterium]|nr:MBL fold metallo-hydrolase [Porphyromonadaceae bacterium]
MILISVFVFILLIAFPLFRHPAFGRLPSGTRLKRIMTSPHYKNGRFQNRQFTPTLTTDKGRMQIFWKFLFKKNPDLRPKHDLPTTKTSLRNLSPDEEIIVWLGHSSLFIQSRGRRFLVDPVLTTRFPASLFLKPFKGTEIYTPDEIPPIDFLLITHDHWDHLDYHTVKALKSRIGKVFCGLGVGAHFEHWGFRPSQIVEMDWDETVSLDQELTLHCLPTRHFSGRGLTPNKSLWVSFLIEGGRRIYLSGDGGYDNRFTRIGQQFPNIDWAIMENGQYSQNWRYIHLLPDDLFHAIEEINPKNVLTIHHSKFALSQHPWYEPLEQIEKISRGKGYRLFTPLIGEKVSLDSIFPKENGWWRNRKNKEYSA